MDRALEEVKIKVESIKRNLLQGKYKAVEERCKSMKANNIRDMVMDVAYDTESICVYGFIQYMIRRTGKTSWIELAIEVMLNPLCFVEGAYSIALFHARELLLIERSVENLERILFFYNIPEKLLDEEEAQYISKEILEIEPHNKVALGVITKQHNIN